jgi:hypothetical protein
VRAALEPPQSYIHHQQLLYPDAGVGDVFVFFSASTTERKNSRSLYINIIYIKTTQKGGLKTIVWNIFLWFSCTLSLSMFCCVFHSRNSVRTKKKIPFFVQFFLSFVHFLHGLCSDMFHCPSHTHTHTLFLSFHNCSSCIMNSFFFPFFFRSRTSRHLCVRADRADRKW